MLPKIWQTILQLLQSFLRINQKGIYCHIPVNASSFPLFINYFLLDTIRSTTATDQLVGKFGRPTPIRVSPKTLVDSRTCRMDAHSCISLSSQFDSELILAKQFLCVLACYYFICNFYGENSRCTFP